MYSLNSDTRRVESPILWTLFDHWKSLRQEGWVCPKIKSFDPVNVPRLLPNIYLVDVLDSDPRFYFRLIGTDIVNFTGRDLTGCYVDEKSYGSFAKVAEDFYRTSCERRQPYGFTGNALWNEGKSWMRVELVSLPLCDEEGTVKRIIGGYVQSHKIRDATQDELFNPQALDDFCIMAHPFRKPDWI